MSVPVKEYLWVIIFLLLLFVARIPNSNNPFRSMKNNAPALHTTQLPVEPWKGMRSCNTIPHACLEAIDPLKYAASWLYSPIVQRQSTNLILALEKTVINITAPLALFSSKPCFVCYSLSRYRSLNCGLTWISKGLSDIGLGFLAIDFSTSRHIY